MRAISLFTGAGGLDLGCEAAGFMSVAAVESDQTARATVGLNLETWFPLLDGRAIFGDILDLDTEELLQTTGLARGEVDLVHGGPPCTPFSKSGYWLAYKRAGEDPKASLLDSFVDVVRETQPKAFLMENVFALGYRNQNRPVFERFVLEITEAGYSFDQEVLVAADYGCRSFGSA
jgi:DNA (cytosine-5)-methyltransferase 1